MKSKFIVIASAVCLLVSLSGCGGTKSPSYVNAEIANSYSDFFAKLNAGKADAEPALDIATQKDPNNAYTQYLKAGMWVKHSDLAKALEAIKSGNKMPKMVHYVSAEPPEDSMKTLALIKRIGYSTDNDKDLGKNASEYYTEVRVMGSRIAKSEPVFQLSILAGISVIRRTFTNQISALAKAKDKAALDKVQKQFEAFDKWDAATKRLMTDQNGDTIKQIAEEAGLSAEESRDFSRGLTLKDSKKQEQADAVRVRINAQERAALIKQLDQMPSL